jgi:ArsR family transcriptional regulator
MNPRIATTNLELRDDARGSRLAAIHISVRPNSLEVLTQSHGRVIVNRRLTMATRPTPTAPTCDSDETVCCPPGQAAELLTAPVEGPAADEELAAFAKAIAHPTRVRILRMLAKREARMCSHIVDELPLAQSTVSEHLRILRSAGLVQANEQGPRVGYCIVPSALTRLKALLEAV